MHIPHIHTDPQPAAISCLVQVESHSGDTYRAFQGHKTGRRRSWIVKVTQSAAKVVTGVSISLSCAAVRHKIKMWITEHLCHRQRHVVCSLRWHNIPNLLQSCYMILLSKEICLCIWLVTESLSLKQNQIIGATHNKPFNQKYLFTI